VSGKIAKRIRREIYGTDYSPRHRSYTNKSGQIVADDRRRAYQRAKKEVSR
jgi:hypothetical protein